MILAYMCSGFLGAIIGVISSFGIALLKECFENEACINAIDSEIRCLNQICDEVFDVMITDDNSPLDLYYPLGTDYFTIFNANSSKIGKIGDRKKRELIVSIYVTAKYFLDCIKTNNECLECFEKAREKYRACPDNQYYSKDLDFARKNLEYSKVDNLIPTYKKLKALLGLYLNG